MKNIGILFIFSVVFMSFKPTEVKYSVPETTIVTISNGEVLVQTWDDGSDCVVVLDEGDITYDDC